MSKQCYDWWSYIKGMNRRYAAGEANQNETAAIEAAIEATERMPNGTVRLMVVQAVLWRRTHTLEGAALQIPCGKRTAERWQSDFIKLVAKNFKCDGLF